MTFRFLHVYARAAVAGSCLAIAGCSMFPSHSERPTVMAVNEKDAPDADSVVTPPNEPAPAAPPVAAPTPPSSSVSELQSLIQSRQVTELRTTYNGTYGASLLFKADDLTYYATLFQDKNFWHVVRTQSEKQAEAAFQSFVRRSEALAEVEMRRIKLQADTEHSERMIAIRNDQLSTLQADQSIRLQQEAAVSQRQAEASAQATELAKQQAQLKRDLRALQQRIDSLQAEQSKIGGTGGVKNTRRR